MKGRLLLLFALATMISSTYAQVDMDKEMFEGSTIILKPGMTLVYGVDYYGTEYDFIVKLVSLNDGIEFDYEMTNQPHTEGKVKISKEALETATAQHNNFSGEHLELSEQTTVWVSRHIFDTLISKGMAEISPDGGETLVLLQKAKAGHDFSLYNAIAGMQINNVSYVYAESEHGKEKYWIHLNHYNPLILRMELGWSIWLKEMRRD